MIWQGDGRHVGLASGLSFVFRRKNSAPLQSSGFKSLFSNLSRKKFISRVEKFSFVVRSVAFLSQLMEHSDLEANIQIPKHVSHDDITSSSIFVGKAEIFSSEKGKET